MKQTIFFAQKVRKYQGRYIAVAGDKIVSSGKSAKEAFESAKKILGSQKIEGVYYIPGKKDLLLGAVGCWFQSHGEKKFFRSFQNLL